MAIEWLPIDPKAPPETTDTETKFLFFWDDEVWTGWAVAGELDGEGYPVWELSEFNVGVLGYVRWYAHMNRPPGEER